MDKKGPGSLRDRGSFEGLHPPFVDLTLMSRRGAVHCLLTYRWPRLETGPRHQQNCADCHKENARPVRSEPKNRTPRRGGSRVSRTGREESGPLRGPRPIAARTMYKIPPRTSSAPSPIRNILASQFIAATHNRTGIQAGAIRFVPWSRHSGAEMPGGKKG